ncbi:helix-turn-helix domain-containing protein [Macrococcoides caseolyticum]|uniref:helix-turn-helix domain-containing protein n=1 Tax=Macrococcoides caseolyticum TaxID=69966 RepID=UPI001F16C221|nr:XRE family transcriptional regulator [Macrococcus caseolyticus]MCE4957789.1 helix-turn-helix transcriptional regulator [Macrococcus caseolyticus]
MKEIHEIVAYNLKHYRQSYGLTLDNVSRRTGVSKTMLSQIERGDSIPSITIVWKIATGLKINISTLIKSPDQRIEVKKKSELMEITGDDGRYRLFPYFTFEADRQIEVYQFEINEGGIYTAEPYQLGAEAYVWVYEGMLNIKIQNEDYQIEQDMAIRFEADITQEWINIGDRTVRGLLTVYYPETKR